MDSTLDLNTFDSLIASYNEESFVASEIEEDFEGCYTFLTPNGTKVWCPNKGCDVKPTVGATYGSWSDVLRMYKNYAECSGFSVRVGQTKKNKSD
ncbi:hypothetical protein R6Q59_027336 [Mikania micrantha]